MKLSRSHIIYYRLLLCVSFVTITYIAATSSQSIVIILLDDKVNHFFAFFILAFLLDFSFPHSRFNTAKIVPLIAYSVLLEVIQYFLPYRIFSFFDIFTDILGLLAFALLIPFIRRLPILGERWAK